MTFTNTLLLAGKAEQSFQADEVTPVRTGGQPSTNNACPQLQNTSSPESQLYVRFHVGFHG